MRKTHKLKCIDPFYSQVVDGVKRFELRKDDRGFEVGDNLELRLYDPTTSKENKKGYIVAEISYILRDAPEYGLTPGYCILSLDSICHRTW